jgi:hypothetical protein
VAKHGAYRRSSIAPADGRGSAYDRRARKAWLLSAQAGFGGNGQAVPCYWCRCPLTSATVEADRFPLCGHSGGGYRRDNIVPACGDCNRTRCSRRGAVCRVRAAAQPELEVRHAG